MHVQIVRLCLYSLGRHQGSRGVVHANGFFYPGEFNSAIRRGSGAIGARDGAGIGRYLLINIRHPGLHIEGGNFSAGAGRGDGAGRGCRR